VIVRISGTGQYELDDDAVRKLDELDTALTDAYAAGDDAQFRECLRNTVTFIQGTGTPVPSDQVVPSEVIVPPEDSGLEDARDYMSDEGLMQPLEA
jgi:PspAA-like protein